MIGGVRVPNNIDRKTAFFFIVQTLRTMPELVEISKLNGSFKRNYGTITGAWQVNNS